MFSRLIGKISSLAKTATLRRFSQENGIDNKQRKPVRIKSSVKEFSTSISTFKKMAQPGKIFVDKSLLIEKLLNTTNKAFLFTRPRRWGKTLNIDMLENFFQADVDEATGIPDFKKQSLKYLFEKLKIKNKKIKQDPISGYPSREKIIKFQGQFPVINLTVNDTSPKAKKVLSKDLKKCLGLHLKSIVIY